MSNPFSCKVVQEGTPPPQIEEEEPITIVAWEILILRIPTECLPRNPVDPLELHSRAALPDGI